MRGYWRNPTATAETFDGDWFKTGDIGELDDDGFLTITGRKKEMLKVKGMSVFPPEIEAVLGQHPAVLGVSGVLLFVEFFADKIPGLDSLWDLLNSVLRVPAGAALAAGVFGADSGTMALMAALLGGTLAASSQVAKTTTRAAINTSPEPFSNVVASLVEDGLVLGALWLATNHPLVFAGVLTVVVVLAAWITWVLLSFLRAAWHRLSRLFSGSEKVA